MADKDRKPIEETDAGTEAAPTEERFADQQFGATAARDQERADRGETLADEPDPRPGNKAEPA